MVAQYLVRKVETCEACEGTGVVYNRGWQEIDEANNAWMQEHTGGAFTEEAMEDWERRIEEKWPNQKPPPEEEPCCECNGEGKIETWIDLRQAMRELHILPEPDLRGIG